MEQGVPLSMSELSDPEALRESRERHELAGRNSDWLQAHVHEIYTRHRGKCICVAGEELFVADTPAEVLAQARAAHPEDGGALLRYIPREKLERVYVAARPMAAL